MGRGVGKGNGAISPPPHDFSFKDQNRPYGNFPFLPGPPCFLEGDPHKLLIFAVQSSKIDGRFSILRQSFPAGKNNWLLWDGLRNPTF